jgi:signal transduction histidine kinase
VFGSLRGKLIASYALVIVLTLVLAGSGFTYVIRAYQTRIRLNQLADLALPLAYQVHQFQRQGTPASDVSQFLKDQAAYLDVRIFLVDPNRQVVLDTGRDLVGQTLPLPTDERKRLGGTMQTGTLDVAGESRLIFVAMISHSERDTAPGGTPTGLTPGATPIGLVIAAPEDRVTTAWLQLAPSLLAGAMAALIVSIAVAVLLARSISKPLAKVTAASERMATGDFDQFIDARGRDEVGQLATSFNTMAREVGRIHQTMRDFLANVSHELRTPLTSIEGFSQAMVDGTITRPEQYREAGRIIGEEAERMHRLVEDLLYLSKIESGQVDIERSRLDLADLLRSCVRQVQPQVETAGLKVEMETTPVPSVLADSHRLQQVFVNLLDNAVKHTPPAGLIQVKAYPVASCGVKAEPDPVAVKIGGAWVAVDVHNTGSYIAPDHADRIFERFYQIDEARLRNGDGSGLGLAIVREIVQAHHGQVEVTSDPKRGTTFTVFLPAAA